MSEIVYSGIDRRGTARTGRVTETTEALVRQFFYRGWRELRVFAAGDLVGYIGPSTTKAKRLWWAVDDSGVATNEGGTATPNP